MATSEYEKPKEGTQELPKETYQPGQRASGVLNTVYEGVREMVQTRNKTYKQFKGRTLKKYIDDNDKIINQYAIDRDAYDPPKEDWQSNVAKTTVRDKQMKVLAGFAMNVPEMSVIARGEDNVLDVNRAELAKHLVRGSYLEEENPTLEAFWEGWEDATKGTVIEYEGYMKNRVKQKFITSYDLVTGQIETEEREVDIDDQCYSYIVPTLELLIDNFYVHNIQMQDRLAWVRYISPIKFYQEFGKYQNAKWVRTKKQLSDAKEETKAFYRQNEWDGRVGEKEIELVRYYCKATDSYHIVANGVLLLDAPLLWSVNKRKMYPFSKTIWSPFDTKHFFYGRSHADVMAGDYENWNTFWNTITDKSFRSMVNPILVGLANQDALELEDELILGGRTKITVPDINQVKEMKTEGATNADVLMLKLIGDSFNEQSPDLSNLLQNKEATAREVVIAEQKLREMKVLYNEMLTDLWRQKYILRLANIALNYPQPRKVTETNENGEIKVTEIYRTYIMNDVELNRLTGETGILAVQFRDVLAKNVEKEKDSISAEEQMMKEQGINYKKLILPTDYFNNWRFQVTVLSDSLWRANMAHDQATVLEKLEYVAKFFPQVFVINQKDYFRQFSSAWNDSPSKYLNRMKQYEEAKANAEQQAKQAQGAMPPSMQPPQAVKDAAARAAGAAPTAPTQEPAAGV